jgi:hypothetical protein
MGSGREVGYRCGHTKLHSTGQEQDFCQSVLPRGLPIQKAQSKLTCMGSRDSVCRECFLENSGEEPPQARYEVGDRVCCGGGDCNVIRVLWETKIGWMYVLEQCYDRDLYEGGQWICEHDVMKGGRRPRRYRGY